MNNNIIITKNYNTIDIRDELYNLCEQYLYPTQISSNFNPLDYFKKFSQQKKYTEIDELINESMDIYNKIKINIYGTTHKTILYTDINNKLVDYPNTLKIGNDNIVISGNLEVNAYIDYIYEKLQKIDISAINDFIIPMEYNNADKGVHYMGLLYDKSNNNIIISNSGDGIENHQKDEDKYNIFWIHKISDGLNTQLCLKKIMILSCMNWGGEFNITKYYESLKYIFNGKTETIKIEKNEWNGLNYKSHEISKISNFYGIYYNIIYYLKIKNKKNIKYINKFKQDINEYSIDKIYDHMIKNINSICSDNIMTLNNTLYYSHIKDNILYNPYYIEKYKSIKETYKNNIKLYIQYDIFSKELEKVVFNKIEKKEEPKKEQDNNNTKLGKELDKFNEQYVMIKTIKNKNTRKQLKIVHLNMFYEFAINYDNTNDKYENEDDYIKIIEGLYKLKNNIKYTIVAYIIFLKINVPDNIAYIDINNAINNINEKNKIEMIKKLQTTHYFHIKYDEKLIKMLYLIYVNMLNKDEQNLEIIKSIKIKENMGDNETVNCMLKFLFSYKKSINISNIIMECKKNKGSLITEKNKSSKNLIDNIAPHMQFEKIKAHIHFSMFNNIMRGIVNIKYMYNIKKCIWNSKNITNDNYNIDISIDNPKSIFYYDKINLQEMSIKFGYMSDDQFSDFTITVEYIKNILHTDKLLSIFIKNIAKESYDMIIYIVYIVISYIKYFDKDKIKLTKKFIDKVLIIIKKNTQDKYYKILKSFPNITDDIKWEAHSNTWIVNYMKKDTKFHKINLYNKFVANLYSIDIRYMEEFIEKNIGKSNKNKIQKYYDMQIKNILNETIYETYIICNIGFADKTIKEILIIDDNINGYYNKYLSKYIYEKQNDIYVKKSELTKKESTSINILLDENISLKYNEDTYILMYPPNDCNFYNFFCEIGDYKPIFWKNSNSKEYIIIIEGLYDKSTDNYAYFRYDIDKKNYIIVIKMMNMKY